MMSKDYMPKYLDFIVHTISSEYLPIIVTMHLLIYGLKSPSMIIVSILFLSCRNLLITIIEYLSEKL